VIFDPFGSEPHHLEYCLHDPTRIALVQMQSVPWGLAK